MRWRDQPAKLLSQTGERVSTFIIVGPTRMPIEEEGASSLLRWVDRGGILVLIDRSPEYTLLKPSDSWTVGTRYPVQISLDSDSDETKPVTPAKPSQPTMLTIDVEEVLPSPYASSIEFTPARNDSREPEDDYNELDLPSETSVPSDKFFSGSSPAPVAHINYSGEVLLVDWIRGRGRIVLLSDPFIVANNGIAQKDNLQLALNLVTGREGLIAIDEYHHGRGVTQNPFVGYFAGTPVLPLVAQLVLLFLLIVYTNARRFARPIPWVEADRRSSLEFVASMAELQHRARAFGLAIENIYGKIRRTLARNAGLEYNSPRSEIANRVAQRFSLSPQHLESVMRECEQTINGDKISDRRSLQLVRELRVLEGKLKLKRH
jgi:hypothetical protein